MRAARQQDFLRQANAAGPQSCWRAASRRQPGEARADLRRATSTATSRCESKQAGASVRSSSRCSRPSKPVREVRFRGRRRAATRRTRARRGPIRSRVHEFMNAKGRRRRPRRRADGRRAQGVAAASARSARRRRQSPGSRRRAPEGEDQAIAGRPARSTSRSTTRAARAAARLPGHRAAHLHDPRRARQEAPRLPARASRGRLGEYYGVQGMTWKNPPILDDPHDTVVRNGRKLRSTTTAGACGWWPGRPGRPSTGSPTRSRRRSARADARDRRAR